MRAARLAHGVGGGWWLALTMVLWSCSGAAAPTSPAPAATGTIAPSTASPNETSEESPKVPPTSSNSASATASAPPDYFGRREEPPAGVEPTLFFSIPNLRPCRNDLDQPGPEVRLGEPVLETPFRTRVCLLGFAAAGLVDVSLVAPGGDTRTESVRADDSGVAEWWFTILPTGQLGSYGIVASQAQTTASNAIDVRRASNPKALAVPDTIHPGERTEIWYDGLAGSSTTPAFLYTLEEGMWQFDAVLPAIVANDSGAGVLTIDASSESPPGSYLVLAGPRTTIKVEP